MVAVAVVAAILTFGAQARADDATSDPDYSDDITVCVERSVPADRLLTRLRAWDRATTKARRARGAAAKAEKRTIVIMSHDRARTSGGCSPLSKEQMGSIVMETEIGQAARDAVEKRLAGFGKPSAIVAACGEVDPSAQDTIDVYALDMTKTSRACLDFFVDQFENSPVRNRAACEGRCYE